MPEVLDPHIQYGAQKASLQRRMKKEYGIGLEELKKLSTVYLVTIAGRNLLSRVSEEQQALLEKMGLKLEVE